MPGIKSPFPYGSLTLSSNIWYAPLAGCSGFAFRKLSARYRPGLHFCEMVKMQALHRLDQETLQMLDFDASMHPIGAQICGADVALAATCARIVEDLGFDAIDLNCGCPVDKVTKDNSGSGLLKTPHRIGEILAAIKAAVKIPVSVKVRTGWEAASINCVEVTKIAEAAGAQAITVHGRTRAQGYRGPADWQMIKACKEAARSILVMGNGDLFTMTNAAAMFAATGCDGLVIARGTLGQPWICRDIERAEVASPQIQLQESLEHILAHVECALAYSGAHRALVELKKAGTWYLQRHSSARALKAQVCQVAHYQEGLDMVRDAIAEGSAKDACAADTT